MSTKPLADAYEKLKDLRRQGELRSGVQALLSIVPDSDLLARLQLVSGELPANLLRIIEVKTLADRVFGDEEKAEEWLQRPNASLSGQTPMDLLKDELGTAVVRELLERIDHGIFA